VNLAVLLAGIVYDILLLKGSLERPLATQVLAARMKKLPWSRHDAATILVMLVGVHGIILMFVHWAHFFLRVPDGDLVHLQIILQTLLFHGGGFAAVLVLMRSKGTSWKAAFGLNRSEIRKSLRTGTVYFLAAMPVVTAATIIYRLFLSHIGYHVEPQGVVLVLADPQSPLSLQIYLIVFASLIAPFVEELLFRGIALPIFSRPFRIPVSVLIVSLLFAAIHFHIPSVVPLFLIACAFSLAYVHSGSILVPIVMHVLFNALNLATLLVFTSVSPV